jgi:hypothetical protein
MFAFFVCTIYIHDGITGVAGLWPNVAKQQGHRRYWQDDNCASYGCAYFSIILFSITLLGALWLNAVTSSRLFNEVSAPPSPPSSLITGSSAAASSRRPPRAMSRHTSPRNLNSVYVLGKWICDLIHLIFVLLNTPLFFAVWTRGHQRLRSHYRGVCGDWSRVPESFRSGSQLGRQRAVHTAHHPPETLCTDVQQPP